MEKEDMSKEDQKILYDWIYRRCREFFDEDTEEKVKEYADRYFEYTFEYGGAEEYLKMAKKDEPYDAYLFRFMNE